MLHFLYHIKDKRTGIIGYVGITSNPNARMTDHLVGVGSNGEKNAWLAQADAEMEILEVLTDRATADQRETETIAAYLALGYPLTNMAKTPPTKQRTQRVLAPPVIEVIVQHPPLEPGDEFAQQEQEFLTNLQEMVEEDVRQGNAPLSMELFFRYYCAGTWFSLPRMTQEEIAAMERWQERTERNLAAYGYEVRAASW